MFGWPEEAAEAVGKAYQALTPEDRARAVFYGRNYGEAAAVDFFGARWGSPPAISAHESYFLWGPRGHDGSVMLILRPSRDDLVKNFRSVEPVGFVDNPLGIPEEWGQTLWLCRDSVRLCRGSGPACATTIDAAEIPRHPWARLRMSSMIETAEFRTRSVAG